VSELTRCNFCILNNIIRRYSGSGIKVGLQPAEDGSGWMEVWVAGQRQASFMELTDHCVC
jgi:hypothetical protein